MINSDYKLIFNYFFLFLLNFDRNVKKEKRYICVYKKVKY